MANLKITTPVRNSMMDVLTAYAGASAKIIIYSGTQPAGGGAAAGLQLAVLVCSVTFAPAASGGVLTLNAITQDSAADNTGTASWFRLAKADDTWILDGDISLPSGSGDLKLDNLNIVIGGTVAMSATQTLTAPNPA